MDESKQKELVLWLERHLEPLCDTNPTVLAKFVLSLVTNDNPLREQRADCLRELPLYLNEKTPAFVDKLFRAVETDDFSVAPQEEPEPPARRSGSPPSGREGATAQDDYYEEGDGDEEEQQEEEKGRQSYSSSSSSSSSSSDDSSHGSRESSHERDRGGGDDRDRGYKRRDASPRRRRRRSRSRSYSDDEDEEEGRRPRGRRRGRSRSRSQSAQRKDHPRTESRNQHPPPPRPRDGESRPPRPMMQRPGFGMPLQPEVVQPAVPRKTWSSEYVPRGMPPAARGPMPGRGGGRGVAAGGPPGWEATNTLGAPGMNMHGNMMEGGGRGRGGPFPPRGPMGDFEFNGPRPPYHPMGMPPDAAMRFGRPPIPFEGGMGPVPMRQHAMGRGPPGQEFMMGPGGPMPPGMFQPDFAGGPQGPVGMQPRGPMGGIPGRPPMMGGQMMPGAPPGMMGRGFIASEVRGSFETAAAARGFGGLNGPGPGGMPSPNGIGPGMQGQGPGGVGGAGRGMPPGNHQMRGDKRDSREPRPGGAVKAERGGGSEGKGVKRPPDHADHPGSPMQKSRRQSTVEIPSRIGASSMAVNDEPIATLMVTGIPSTVNQQVLMRHFRGFGRVVNFAVQPDPATTTPETKNCSKALVQFAQRAEAERCLMSPTAVANNRFITVQWADANAVQQEQRGHGQNDRGSGFGGDHRPQQQQHMGQGPVQGEYRGGDGYGHGFTQQQRQEGHMMPHPPQHQQEQQQQQQQMAYKETRNGEDMHGRHHPQQVQPPYAGGPSHHAGHPHTQQQHAPLQQPPPYAGAMGHHAGHPHTQQQHAPLQHQQQQHQQQPPRPSPRHQQQQGSPQLQGGGAGGGSRAPNPEIEKARADLLRKKLDIAKQKEALYTKQVTSRKGLLSRMQSKPGTTPETLEKVQNDLDAAEAQLAQARDEVASLTEQVSKLPGGLSGGGVQVIVNAMGLGRGGPNAAGPGGRWPGRGGRVQPAGRGRGRGRFQLDNRTTYVKLLNRPLDVPEQSLQSYFGNFGVVESLSVDGGAAIIKFASRHMAEKAMATAKYIGETQLQLRWHDPRLPQGRRVVEGVKGPGSRQGQQPYEAGREEGAVAMGGQGQHDEALPIEPGEMDAIDDALFGGDPSVGVGGDGRSLTFSREGEAGGQAGDLSVTAEGEYMEGVQT